MNESVEARVYQVFADQLTRDIVEIAPEKTFEAIGADSLDRVEIVMKVEEIFDVELDDDELEKLTTVGELARYVSAAVEKKNIS